MFSASQVCHYWRSVLTSSPFLWTRINCRCAPRSLASLERSKSIPIQLRLERSFSNVALRGVLLHESGISSLITSYHPREIQSSRKLLTGSRQSLEQVHIYAGQNMWGQEDPIHDLWDHLPSLRELVVFRYQLPIARLDAHNLVHMVLERVCDMWHRKFTVRTILDTLLRCPLLETLLLDHSGIISQDSSSPSSVCLRHLRSIELGQDEARSGLITSLQFSRSIAVGFRMIRQYHIYNDTPSELVAAIQHVLGRTDIRSITLAASHNYTHMGILIRFEGPGGTLEITTERMYSPSPPHVLLALETLLRSPLPGIETATELHIVGCPFDRSQAFRRVNKAMRNLTSISFFNCDEDQVFRLLTQTHDSSPPFPCLERVMVLGHEPKLEHMARRRKKLGVSLKTFVIGRWPKGFVYNSLTNSAALRGLVGDLRVGCPTEILEWGTGNDILDLWSHSGVPVSLSEKFACTGPHSTI